MSLNGDGENLTHTPLSNSAPFWTPQLGWIVDRPMDVIKLAVIRTKAPAVSVRPSAFKEKLTDLLCHFQGPLLR